MALLTFTMACPAMAGIQESNKYAGAVRIAKLLWAANADSAASTLQSTMKTALSRKEAELLGESLLQLQSQMQTVVDAADEKDARWAVSIAGLQMIHAEQAQPVLQESAMRFLGTLDQEDWERESAAASIVMESLFVTQPAEGLAILQEQLSGDGSQAVGGLVLEAMATIALRQQPEKTVPLLIEQWSELSNGVKLQVIEPMTSAELSMIQLLEAIEAGVVEKSLVNPNQLRKWTQASGDDARDIAAIQAKIEKIWGKIRETNDEQRQALVRATVKRLNSGVSGSVAKGQAVFAKVCSQCHRHNGVGYEVGPNITGNGRGSLPQLVSNVLDPSLVIGEAFQSKTILTVDGKVVSGLIAEETERFLKLKTQGGKVLEFEKDEIELVKTSEKSLMPEGLEQQLTEQELYDLLAYLCLLKPLTAAENELIPGTPAGFVQE